MRFQNIQGLLAGFHGDDPDPDVPELDRAGEEWLPRNARIPLHSHRDWELYLQIDGVSCWEGPDRCYLVGPGCLFLPPPGVIHALTTASRSSHHFMFAGVDIATVLGRIPDVSGAWNRSEIFFASDAARLIGPFRLLIREVSLNQPYRALGIRAAIDALIVEASRLMTDDREPSRYLPGHQAVSRAVQAMEEHPELPWRQKELSDTCGLSASRLQQLFTQQVGVPPRQFLLQVRADRAKGMLESTDTPITEIGIELGFSSSQHFAVAFRRIAGESPTAFRDRRRAMPGAPDSFR